MVRSNRHAASVASGCPCRPSQRLRRLPNGAQEGAAHPAGVAKTRGFGDALERGVTCLYRRPSGLQT